MTEKLLNVFQAEPKHTEPTEYPKWVVPDPSHISHKKDGSIKTVEDHDFFINRDTEELTVLVVDYEDEKKMTEPKGAK